MGFVLLLFAALSNTSTYCTSRQFLIILIRIYPKCSPLIILSSGDVKLTTIHNIRMHSWCLEKIMAHDTILMISVSLAFHAAVMVQITVDERWYCFYHLNIGLFKFYVTFTNYHKKLENILIRALCLCHISLVPHFFSITETFFQLCRKNPFCCCCTAMFCMFELQWCFFGYGYRFWIALAYISVSMSES